MSTRAEQYKAAQQRHGQEGSGIRKARSKPGIPPAERSHDKAHAERKATYALEETSGARPSRKSTRKAANRSKPDTNFNLREEREKTAPTARFRKALAKSVGGHRKPAGEGAPALAASPQGKARLRKAAPPPASPPRNR